MKQYARRENVKGEQGECQPRKNTNFNISVMDILRGTVVAANITG